MRYVELTPLDTLFFRDGSPFTAGETGQMEVRGVFPPAPTTVVGALRAAFARQLGWTGGPWGADLVTKLGDGDDLGPLRFSGPYLTRGGEPLFPAPLHLLRTKVAPKDKREDERNAKAHFTWLKPGAALQTDIGTVKLPEVVEATDDDGQPLTGFKPLEDAYLTLEGMQRVVRGELPDPSSIIPSSDLWQSEARVGIHRDDSSRTTKEDALYQTVHVRLCPGVSLVMGVSGFDGDLPELLTLGGESRMVAVGEADFKLPEAHLGGDRYTVTLLTPARFADGGWRTPGGSLPGLPGRIASACVGKPVMIGGWDGEARRPKELTPHLPPGSVFFMEGAGEDVTGKHGTHIGQKTTWGYGQILIGAW